MHGVGHHHRVETGFEGLGHEGLQGARLDRQTQPGHPRQDTGIARGDAGHPARADKASAGLDAGDGAVALPNPGDLRLLQDIHAVRVRSARVAPGDGIVTGDAAARLPGRTHYGIA